MNTIIQDVSKKELAALLNLLVNYEKDTVHFKTVCNLYDKLSGCKDTYKAFGGKHQ